MVVAVKQMIIQYGLLELKKVHLVLFYSFFILYKPSPLSTLSLYVNRVGIPIELDCIHKH
jgi:hypothetical protein